MYNGRSLHRAGYWWLYQQHGKRPEKDGTAVLRCTRMRLLLRPIAMDIHITHYTSKLCNEKLFEIGWCIGASAYFYWKNLTSANKKIVPNVETVGGLALRWILMVYLSVLLAGKGKNRKFQCDFPIRYKKWLYIDEYQEKSYYGRLVLYRCFYIRIDYIGWFRFIKT